MKKTEVEKALEKLPPETRLKVGAKSGFFYCGTVEDFLEHMDEYSFFAERRVNSVVKKARTALKVSYESNVSPGEYARNKITVEEPHAKLSSAGYMRYLDAYFDGIERLMQNVMRAEESLLEFKPFRSRTVKRLEKTSLEKNCYLLILSGDELGRFWELSEAKESSLSFVTEGEETDG